MLDWPIITIDIEASALDAESYPIEVGVCRWQALQAGLETWSALIKPSASWERRGVWSRASEGIHGIAQRDLESGLRPRAVMEALNRLGRGRVLWCDGGEFDAYWAQRLADAAGVPAEFSLGNWADLVRCLRGDQQATVAERIAKCHARHRAKDDAAMLMRALAFGLGVDPGEALPLSI